MAGALDVSEVFQWNVKMVDPRMMPKCDDEAMRIIGERGCFKLFAGEWVPTEPLGFRLPAKRALDDMMDATDWIGVTPLSDRVVQILASRGISGWRTYAANMHDKAGNSVGKYHGLMVPGQCGPLTRVAPQFASMPGDDGKQVPVFKGGEFDPATWDGSDIFRPAGTAVTYVVEKVKKLLEETGATGLQFRPLVAGRLHPPVKS